MVSAIIDPRHQKGNPMLHGRLADCS